MALHTYMYCLAVSHVDERADRNLHRDHRRLESGTSKGMITKAGYFLPFPLPLPASLPLPLYIRWLTYLRYKHACSTHASRSFEAFMMVSFPELAACTICFSIELLILLESCCNEHKSHLGELAGIGIS